MKLGAKFDNPGCTGHTPLIIACRRGYNNLISYYLEKIP